MSQSLEQQADTHHSTTNTKQLAWNKSPNITTDNIKVAQYATGTNAVTELNHCARRHIADLTSFPPAVWLCGCCKQ